MSLRCFLMVFCLVIQTGCNAQDSSDPPNVKLIQKQLQDLLDQEIKLEAMKRKLLQQLENGESRRQGLNTPAPIPPNTASSVDKVKPLTNPIGVPKTKSRITNYPFTEVQLESTGIRILPNKRQSRRRIFSS